MSSLPANFTNAFRSAQTQLLARWIPADLETPVSAYLKLCHDEDYSLLLESVEGGVTLGRYSAIGLKPDLFWKYQDGQATTSQNTQDWTPVTEEPLQSLKTLIHESRIDAAPDDLPPMASSGLFGLLGYDMIRLVEDIPDSNPDTLDIPDGIMMRPTLIIIFDNVKHMMGLFVPVREHSGNSDKAPQAVYDEAKAQIDAAIERLNGPVPSLPEQENTGPLPAPQSNVTREEYHAMVNKAVEEIHAGEAFQIVPSQRFSVPFPLPPFALYRALRRLNPSPFLFYLQFGDFAIVGSSPEILVRVRGGTVTIRPIAGTRPRGKTPEEDKALAEDLLSDPKEQAEHLMLLDLGRNDVGRVAEIGSVRVTEQFTIENYSHVMHIVSNVEGTLKKDIHPLDALFAGFPAGTVSGAPKIRAMEIIDELENVRRSFYAGCVGYLDGHGDVDTAITLRTGLVKDGMLYVQAGGGVVADSDPEAEYQETCNKAKALLEAARVAVEG